MAGTGSGAPGASGAQRLRGLEREQRVPAGGGVQALQRRARIRDVEPLAQDTAERSEADRAEPDRGVAARGRAAVHLAVA